MDILRTAWIPTDVGTVATAEALESATDIRWHRGDWDLATFCLLHAMLQTAVVLEPGRCPNRRAWERQLHQPADGLQKWFDWDLGDRPWECMTANGLVPIGRLLPETPGDNALKKSSDIVRWQHVDLHRILTRVLH